MEFCELKLFMFNYIAIAACAIIYTPSFLTITLLIIYLASFFTIIVNLYNFYAIFKAIF